MRLHRVLAYLLTCAAFVAAALVYLEYVYQLGFPDGFITELGFAERRLAYIFIGTSIVSGLFFLYLGWTGSRKKIGGNLYVSILVYSIFVAVVSFVDYYYRQNFMNGGGG